MLLCLGKEKVSQIIQSGCCARGLSPTHIKLENSVRYQIFDYYVTVDADMLSMYLVFITV